MCVPYVHGWKTCIRKWSRQPLDDMYLDEAGVELFKTHFYEFEGWDPKTGWPTRKTLEELNLKKAADIIGIKGKRQEDGVGMTLTLDMLLRPSFPTR
jgi:hypothetical protein